MPVPTHGPHCRTLSSYWCQCPDCNQEVFYFACTCGSKVFLDPLGDRWSRHECDGVATGGRIASTYIYSVLSVICPRCGKTVRNRDLGVHNYYTHRIGERPVTPANKRPNSKRAVKSSSYSRPQAKGKKRFRPMVVCEICNQSVRKSQLEKHMQKAHPHPRSTNTPPAKRRPSSSSSKRPPKTVSAKTARECDICGTPVPRGGLIAHMWAAHPTQAAQYYIRRGEGQ